MSKPKILINFQDRVTWHEMYLRDSFAEYFDIINYEEGKSYNANEYIIVTSVAYPNSWYIPFAQQGVKIIYDALWEYHVTDSLPSRLPVPGFISKCKEFFWVNEYFVNTSQNYHLYRPNKNVTHKALLPIRLTKPSRMLLLSKLRPWLDQIIYSQVDHGRFLPNDQNESHGSFQRYFNPEWYDSTMFSVVSETLVNSGYPLHITEKTFKPITYFHPFVIWGQAGTLAYLHKLGFETYDNLFNESYDQEVNQNKRLDMVVKNIVEFDCWAYDNQTEQKLQYNYNLFYDANKIQALFKQSIVDPILEYAET